MRKFIAVLIVAITVMAIDVGSASACKRGKRGKAVVVSDGGPYYTQSNYGYTYDGTNYGTYTTPVYYNNNAYPYNGPYYGQGVYRNGYYYPNNYGYGPGGYYGRGYNPGTGVYIQTGRGFRGR